MKTATVHAQQKWEYMEVTRKTETYLVSELCELGKVGWELVSVFFHKDTRAGPAAAQVWTAFLKRPHAAHSPSAPTDEKADTPAPVPAQQPAKLEPSDTDEDFDFAEAPPSE